MNVAPNPAATAPLPVANPPASGGGAEPSDGQGFAQALQQARAPGGGAQDRSAPGRAGTQRDNGASAAKPAGASAPASGPGTGRTQASETQTSSATADTDSDATASPDADDEPPTGADAALAWLWPAAPDRSLADRAAPHAKAGRRDSDAAAPAAGRRSAAVADGRWPPGGSALTGTAPSAHSLSSAPGDATQHAELADDPRGAFASALAAATPGQTATVPGASPASAAAMVTALAGGAGVASPASAPADAAAQAGAMAEHQLHAPLHSPEFAPALGAQLTLLVREGVTEARLQLNPAEMGPIAVQIQLDGTQARVEMVAEQAQTRQVLEQSMPSLASALRESGLTLAGGGVFQQSARQGRHGEDASAAAQGRPGPAGGTEAAVGSAEAVPGRSTRPRGVVDLYA